MGAEGEVRCSGMRGWLQNDSKLNVLCDEGGQVGEERWERVKFHSTVHPCFFLR